MPATAPPKRRVLGGISTTPSSSSSAAASTPSSTSPNPVRVLRPNAGHNSSASVHVRPVSSQGVRPLSSSTLSPPSTSSSSSPRIRAKVDLSNIVSSGPSSAAAPAPSHAHHAAFSTSGRTSPLKFTHQQAQAALRRTGSTASIPSHPNAASASTTAPPRIHLSASTGHALAGASSSPTSARSNSVSTLGGVGHALTSPPSPHVTVRAKHRNQSVDLSGGPPAIGSHASSGTTARLPSSLAPSSSHGPHSPQSHRRISSSSAATSLAASSISTSPFPSREHHSTISPPSSSVSSSTSSIRRPHVGNGSVASSGGVIKAKVQSPVHGEFPTTGKPPSISLATPYESPTMRVDFLHNDLSPTSRSDPFQYQSRVHPNSSGPSSLILGSGGGASSSSTSPHLPSIVHELQQSHESFTPSTTETLSAAENEARFAAAVAAVDAKKERKMLDLEITNKSLIAINANLEKERLKMSKEMRELRRRATLAGAAAAASGGAGGSSAFGSGIGGFIALLRGGRKHSADGSVLTEGGSGGGGDDAGASAGDELRSPGANGGFDIENDEEYWLNAAMAELTDDEDGGASDDDDDDADSALDDDDALDGLGEDGDEDAGSALDGVGTRKQRARQRAIAERKVAQLVRDWQSLDDAHTRCRSLVEDMLLRGRLACKLSLAPDQAEIVEEVRREEEAAEEERRRLLELERRRGTRVLHPAEMEERQEAARREREEREAQVAEEPPLGNPESAKSPVGAAEQASAEGANPNPEGPPTIVLSQNDDGEDSQQSGTTDSTDLDNSDARSDISSRTERGVLGKNASDAATTTEEGDVDDLPDRSGTAADISVD
ncbi:hypothetical protein V8E36_002968 [Tilletia maclaganii]